jgi:hypothetical protein
MKLSDDPIDTLLEDLVSDSESIAASIDPARIRAAADGDEPRTLTLWAAAAFASAVAGLLVLFLGVGIGGHSDHPSGHQKITPATSSKPSTSEGTVNPFLLTPDPDDPGWACKEGTGEAGTNGSMERIQTLGCSSTVSPVQGEGPLREGVTDQQLAKDLDWSYVPDPGAPVTSSAATDSQTRSSLFWKTDPEDQDWACKVGTVEAGTAHSLHPVWALQCKALVERPRTVSPLSQGLSDMQIAHRFGWESVPPPGSTRIVYAYGTSPDNPSWTLNGPAASK